MYSASRAECIKSAGTPDLNNKDAKCKASGNVYTCLRKFVADAPNKEQECKDETVKKNMEAAIKQVEGDLKNAGCSVPTGTATSTTVQIGLLTLAMTIAILYNAQ